MNNSDKAIRILYLSDRNIFLNKTSRVRFHAVQAIAKRCALIRSGPGWEGWDKEETLEENIRRIYEGKERPDLVFCYKPYTIKGFANTPIPTCVAYNEMGARLHPRSYTVKEIMDNRVDLVICHHRNEMLYPEFAALPCKLVNISHCAEISVFHDYHQPKEIDVLLVGALHLHRYPFRTRLGKILLNMRKSEKFSQYTTGIWNHPGRRYPNAYRNIQASRYAKEISRSKICLTCSGRYRSRYAKYAEIPACRSLLMADLPDEDEEFFRQFVVVIDMSESNQKIEDKILYYLEHDQERERLTDLGYTLTRQMYTQDHYAERFLRVVSDFLEEFQGKKIPFWRKESD